MKMIRNRECCFYALYLLDNNSFEVYRHAPANNDFARLVDHRERFNRSLLGYPK